MNDLVIKRSTSMESSDPGVVTPRSRANLSAQKEEVLKEIMAKGFFNAELMESEVDWFYNPKGLGMHEFYFSGHSSKVIASHIQSIVAAKMLSVSSGAAMDVNLEQESRDSAFFATRSNVQGDASNSTRCQQKNIGPTEVETLERRIEKKFFCSSTECTIGDGVKSGLEALRGNSMASIGTRHYRLQCYRSSGVLDPNLAPSHVRMYFLQAPDFVEPNPADGEDDIHKLADRRFLERAGDNLKSVYQSLLTQATKQIVPVVHTEMWIEPDGSPMARFAIAYQSGATHSYFSSIADVYRAHGLFSTRKYVEYFSNGIVIYGFYLQKLDKACRGSGTFEDRVKACIVDTSMHYVLPRTSLTPMLRDNLLSPQEISYAYGAWKFAFHFLQRLPEAYNVVASSLRVKDPGALGRLEQLRNTMKFNTYTENQILEEILVSAPIVKLLYKDFCELHQPGQSSSTSKEEMESTIRKSVQSETALVVFQMFLTFNRHILRTNFFRPKKAALAFRLDGKFLSETEFPEKPFAVIFVIGSEFRGFHVRFLDIARGGIRMIRSSSNQVYARNVSSLFDECYSLASTQQRKNKDIPEGGSKGVILLNLAHQDKAKVAFQKYIDALLDIMLPVAENKKFDKEELLFLGPDEGTADVMDWASSYAKARGYRYWKAITTGKSATRGGIPHDAYGMTTHSVRQYVVGIQEKLGLHGPSMPRITKVQTGGPDGDLGSNEILMSEQEDTIAVVDGSGVLYDPSGINRQELVRLAKERCMIVGFEKSKISNGGYAVLVNENEVTLPEGELVENGTQFRNTFHLRKSLMADFFVPCGGRPSAVNLSNVEEFMYGPNGKSLRFKYIVEGANLFFTQDARLVLEKAGVILFKDASANKGGVTSSSLEVMAAMTMEDEEFKTHMCVTSEGVIPPFYKKYVGEVQRQIDWNASSEFECLWNEHQVSGKPYSILSNELSEKITDLTVKVQTSSLWDNKPLREQLLDKAIPDSLLSLLGRDVILARLPESYTRAVFASQLASRFVYKAGLRAPEFAFYEFVQQM